MKIFCFLLSFVFVHVTTTDELTDYKREVLITNAHIELAYDMKNVTVENTTFTNGLEQVITKIVNIEINDYRLDIDYDRPFFDLWRAEIAIMNIMIAVPEYYAYFYDLDEAINIQRGMQNEIRSELGIAVPAVPDQIFEELVLTQLGEERRRFTGKVLKDMMSNALSKYAQ
ncbi:uncharacterized protein LOC126847459 [Adelges cooleyi]|uniref:uncharacterized protein LOC126847459 n=1 Tax=Adelges cooleyi TaxID=133065 RepID=UPI00217F368E|nr:uncharacterized protein LOC126847459 [Adelges cooleyi]